MLVKVLKLFHRCHQWLTVEKSEGIETDVNLDEASVSDHATTGSDTESDVDTTVRPKVSFKDIQAPDGTVLHQHAKFKTLHLMKSDNRVVFLCGSKPTATLGLLQSVMRLTPQSAVSAFVQS